MNRNSSKGEQVRTGHDRIEAALTRDALAQPRRKALQLARKISERGAEWERAEISRAEAQAERLRVARENLRVVMAENSPTQPRALEREGEAIERDPIYLVSGS